MNVEKIINEKREIIRYPFSRAYMAGIRKGLRMNLTELGVIIKKREPRFRGGSLSDFVPLAERRKRGKIFFFEGLCTAHRARTKKAGPRKRVVRHRPSARPKVKITPAPLVPGVDYDENAKSVSIVTKDMGLCWCGPCRCRVFEDGTIQYHGSTEWQSSNRQRPDFEEKRPYYSTIKEEDYKKALERLKKSE